MRTWYLFCTLCVFYSIFQFPYAFSVDFIEDVLERTGDLNKVFADLNLNVVMEVNKSFTINMLKVSNGLEIYRLRSLVEA